MKKQKDGFDIRRAGLDLKGNFTPFFLTGFRPILPEVLKYWMPMLKSN